MTKAPTLSDELLELAIKVAKNAGVLLMQRPQVFNLNEKSSIRDFATQMDHESERLIVDQLLSARPEDGLIGEEGASRESKSGITWVIDPIDGTVNYFYGLPGWNISIAAKDSEGVLVGVVFAPTINSLWSAKRGGGAFLNQVKIQVNEPVELEYALIATGFSYDHDQRIAQAVTMARLIPLVRDIRRNGAAAVDLCFVAMGALDGYFEASLKEWDLAAGGLMVTEAGGMVTGRDGGSANSEMVIAAGPTLHAQLVLEIG